MGNVKLKLFEAVERGDVDLVGKILDKKPEITNHALANGGTQSALIRAAWRGNLEMVKYIAKKGGDINRQSMYLGS